MECRLVENENAKWRCDVTLRMEVDKNGMRLEKPIELKFGESISSVDQVEDRLRRAQKAVLCPSITDFKLILEAKDLDDLKNEISFTENVVCMLITGKDVGNLTLIDLPGIISSTESSKDNHYIKLVTAMTLKFIKSDNIIIVECLTCKDDIDNQSVHTLARECDPDGARTIGVLTKPDTIEQGCSDRWLRIMKGETHRLHHGYYMVKNPNKEDLLANISFEDARSKEMSIFTTTEPWNAYPELNGRLGVSSLKNRLSQWLVKMVDDCLPEIVGKTTNWLAEIEDELEKLPPPVENKRLTLNQVINSFVADVSENLNLDRQNFLREEKARLQSMRISIKRTIPVLTHMDKPCHLNRTDESDEDEEYDRENAFGISMTINEVKNAIDEFKGRDFAGLFQNEVVKRLIQISLANWKEPTIKCLDETDKAIIATIESICRDYKRFPTLQGHLRYVHYSFVLQSNNIISIRSLSILAGVKSETREHLNRLLEIERMCISLNDHYLLATQKIFSDMLTSVFSNTKPVANGENMKNAVAYLAAAGITGLTASQIIDRLTDLKDESYKEPIEVFARVKSYLKVAYKRHVDNVAAGIISEFVCKFSRILGEKLPMQLANDEENLINEDTAIVAKRQELLNRKARLSKVKEDLIKSNLI